MNTQLNRFCIRICCCLQSSTALSSELFDGSSNFAEAYQNCDFYVLNSDHNVASIMHGTTGALTCQTIYVTTRRHAGASSCVFQPHCPSVIFTYYAESQIPLGSSWYLYTSRYNTEAMQGIPAVSFTAKGSMICNNIRRRHWICSDICPNRGGPDKVWSENGRQWIQQLKQHYHTQAFPLSTCVNY